LAGEIAQPLFEEDHEISVSTVELVLAEEGYPKLPRRTRHKVGLTVKGSRFPERAGAVREAGLPGSRELLPLSYPLSFLTLKLLGTELYSLASDYAFDPGLKLFAGLGVLPKTTAMSTYSSSLDAVHVEKLERALNTANATLSARQRSRAYASLLQPISRALSIVDRPGWPMPCPLLRFRKR
jgi:hypothetical protein